MTFLRSILQTMYEDVRMTLSLWLRKRYSMLFWRIFVSKLAMSRRRWLNRNRPSFLRFRSQGFPSPMWSTSDLELVSVKMPTFVTPALTTFESMKSITLKRLPIGTDAIERFAVSALMSLSSSARLNIAM